MAKTWKEAVSKKLVDSSAYVDVETTQTYKDLKGVYGLETLIWKSFKIDKSNIDQRVGLVKEFIEKYKPCLFIWDPLDDNNGLSKDFLFNVSNPDGVTNWIYENLAHLSNYQFLVTSQICNTNNGFVGNCISDGKGKLFIETLHKPGVCNQREFSKPKEDIGEWLDFAVVQDFSLESASGKFLTREDVKRLVDVYGEKKGFFEFVKGVHLGKNGYYSVGCEKGSFFCFPEEMHLNKLVNAEYRLMGKLVAEKKEDVSREIIGEKSYYS